MRYIEFTDCKGKKKHIPGKLRYFGTPEQELIDELGLRKNIIGTGIEEYELSLQEIAAKGWELAFVLPIKKYTDRGKFGESTLIENKYIFKKEK